MKKTAPNDLFTMLEINGDSYVSHERDNGKTSKCTRSAKKRPTKSVVPSDNPAKYAADD